MLWHFEFVLYFVIKMSSFANKYTDHFEVVNLKLMVNKRNPTYNYKTFNTPFFSLPL